MPLHCPLRSCSAAASLTSGGSVALLVGLGSALLLCVALPALLERRLTGGRDGVRAKLGGVARFFNGTGAQQGSFLAPTATQRQVVTEAKAELMAVEKELKSVATAK